MTAPVLRPVRWWRNDAERYIGRGGYVIASDPSVGFQPMPPLSPDVARMLAMYREQAFIKPLEFEALPPQPKIETMRMRCGRLPLSAVMERPLTFWRDRDLGDEQPAERWSYAHVRFGGVICRYPGRRARALPCGLDAHDGGDEDDARTGPIELRPMSYCEGIEDDEDLRIDKT